MNLVNLIAASYWIEFQGIIDCPYICSDLYCEFAANKTRMGHGRSGLNMEVPPNTGHLRSNYTILMKV